MVMRSAVLSILLSTATAFHAPTQIARVPRGTPRASLAMLASEAVALSPQLSSLTSVGVATTQLPSLLLSDGLVDVLGGFIGSPLILLVPIGAGAAVAFAIIFVLVKSADPSPPRS